MAYCTSRSGAVQGDTGAQTSRSSTSRSQIYSHRGPQPSCQTLMHARQRTSDSGQGPHRQPARPCPECGIAPAFHRAEDWPRPMSITSKYVQYSPRSSPPVLDPALDPAKRDGSRALSSCAVAEARGTVRWGTMLLYPDAPLPPAGVVGSEGDGSAMVHGPRLEHAVFSLTLCGAVDVVVARHRSCPCGGGVVAIVGRGRWVPLLGIHANSCAACREPFSLARHSPRAAEFGCCLTSSSRMTPASFSAVPPQTRIGYGEEDPGARLPGGVW